MTLHGDEQTPTLQFLGGAGTVTGSKYLVHVAGRKVLLDCGLFQGLKELRLRNWREPPFDPSTIDAVILSHAHIDHSGYLPLLVRRGFRGPVFCTPATQSLLRIMLPDAAHIQEEEAAYANRKGFSKHDPAQPLFTGQDGARFVRMHGRDVAVHASVETIDGLSGHADQRELMRWLRGFTAPPRKTYIVHGENAAATALRQVIRAELGWDTDVAEDLRAVELASK